jgi:ribosome maturation factor RimP
VLEAHGVTLDDLAFVTDRSGWTLRITIDRESSSEASGGVTLADCAEVSRDASAVLDVEDFIPHRYHLEVSSPGLDRPLRTERDFRRFVGQLAKVKLSHAASDGQKLLRGTIDEAPEGRVAVIVDGKRLEVAYGTVVEANLVYELQSAPKKKASGPKKKQRQ